MFSQNFPLVAAPKLLALSWSKGSTDPSLRDERGPVSDGQGGL